MEGSPHMNNDAAMIEHAAQEVNTANAARLSQADREKKVLQDRLAELKADRNRLYRVALEHENQCSRISDFPTVLSDIWRRLDANADNVRVKTATGDWTILSCVEAEDYREAVLIALRALRYPASDCLGCLGDGERECLACPFCDAHGCPSNCAERRIAIEDGKADERYDALVDQRFA